MKRKMTLCLLLVTTLLIVQGCDCDCDEEKDDCIKKNGQPEEIDSYSSDGYNNVDYWYWTKGVEYSFTWGDDVSDCCQKSTYTFDPIGKNASEAEKKAAMESKVRADITTESRTLLGP